MKKNLLLIGAALLALASCSKSADLEVNPNTPDAIKFNAYTGKGTKVATTTNANFKEFHVSAVKTTSSASTITWSEQLHFNDIIVSRTNAGGNGNWETATTLYWPTTPDNAKLVFFGWTKNDDITYTAPVASPATAPKLVFSGQTDLTKQHDLLVAVTPVTAKAASGATTVNMPFIHALSKISFKASVNKGYKLTINSMAIANLISDGTYTFPSTSTGEASGDNNITNPTSTLGTWTNKTVYGTFPIAVDNTNSANILTATVNNVIGQNITTEDGAILKVPTNVATTAWTPKSKGGADAKTIVEAGTSYTYLKVEYKLQYSSTNEYILGGASTYQTAYIPFTCPALGINKHYIITVNFGNGGGYDDKGEELLPASNEIKFTTSVSEWGNPNESGVDM